jgi:hypothetical protein
MRCGWYARASAAIVAAMLSPTQRTRAACAALALATLASCASIEITRDTQTSGRFVSKGFAVTLFSVDIPKAALNIARDNASDARMTNTQVTHVTVTPYLGWFDWLLDIVGVRWASVRGTWGFSGEGAGAAGAKPGSSPGS